LEVLEGAETAVGYWLCGCVRFNKQYWKEVNELTNKEYSSGEEVEEITEYSLIRIINDTG